MYIHTHTSLYVYVLRISVHRFMVCVHIYICDMRASVCVNMYVYICIYISMCT